MGCRLSNKELEVMRVLWSAGKDLSITEFVQYDPTLSTNTVQSALRSLLKKSYIEVANIVQHNKVFARTFRPLISETEYMLERFSESTLKTDAFFAALVEKEDDPETLNAMEEIISRQKKKLLKKD